MASHTWRTHMKTLIATAALAAVIAVPAQAQTVDRRPLGAQSTTQIDQYGRSEVTRRGIGSGVPVYDGDRYLGADPDPNVRLNLRMDWQHHD